MDLQQAFDEGFDALKGYVDRSFDAFAKQIAALEQRLAALPVAKDGKDANEDAIVVRVSEKMADELASLRGIVQAIEIPETPPFLELPDIGKMVEDAIQKQMAVEDLEHNVEELVKAAVGEIPAPKDGKDADPDEVKRLVNEAVKAIPTPKDGTSVTVDDVAPLISSEVEKRVSQLPLPKDGKDGLDVKEMFRAEGGKLVAVMSDGTTRDLGVFVGKDGQDADMAAIEKSIAEKVDAIPRPKDGKDGFSLKHFDAELMEDGRTVLLKFQDDSDQSYSVELGIPAMIYRGVFKEGQSYEKGDTVTWGGSLWHCDQSETTSKPDGAEKHWTLAAKKGRDGRDGEVKAAREPAKVKI